MREFGCSVISSFGGVSPGLRRVVISSSFLSSERMLLLFSMNGLCYSRLALLGKNCIPSVIFLFLLLVQGGDIITFILWCSRFPAALILVPWWARWEWRDLPRSCAAFFPRFQAVVVWNAVDNIVIQNSRLPYYLPWFFMCDVVRVCCRAPYDSACMYVCMYVCIYIFMFGSSDGS